MMKRRALLTAAAAGAGAAAYAWFGGEAPLELWLGGDVHCGEQVNAELGPLRGLLRGAGIINLEGPVGPLGPARGRLRLRNRAAMLPTLAGAGVRAVGIANNHLRDAGPDGARKTAAALRAAGLLPCGDVAGVAAIAASARVSAHHLVDDASIDGLQEQLAAAASEADILISTFHLTAAPSLLPSPLLRRAVDVAIEAGARVVAAHGSHMLGPVERRGQAVIAWGLGNLLFDCPCTDERDAILLAVSISAETTTAQVIPIRAGLNGEPATAAPDPALLLDLLEALGSSPLRRDGAGAFV